MRNPIKVCCGRCDLQKHSLSAPATMIQIKSALEGPRTGLNGYEKGLKY
jgi:hypothetical protein